MHKYSEGQYEAGENILHLWYPRRVDLKDVGIVEEFFRESLDERIRPCPQPPYLLVSYTNVHLRPDMTDAYAACIERIRGYVLGTFRYGIDPDALGQFTAVAVRLGNLKLAAPSNMFATEGEARAAIRQAKARAR